MSKSFTQMMLFAVLAGAFSHARAQDFDAPREWARLQDKRISESSGLAAAALVRRDAARRPQAVAR